MDIDFGTAVQLVAALKARKLSATELLKHTIARIELFDRSLNAVVVRDFDHAFEAAATADAALARGDSGPLLGIPVTFKEAFNIGGLPTTWGFARFQGFVAKEDALAVVRAKRAGAVVLGKTNVPPGLGDFQSYNDVYGVTNNPWDPGRSPGGSSGGSAAALAAGFGPLSFGSDIGGSVRVPAHFCGVYAHKPTHGLVPVRGYSPPPPFPPLLDDLDLAVIGPMARSAADLELALDVVMGPDKAHDGMAYRVTLPPARHGNLKDYRVLVVDAHPLMPIDGTIREALDRLSDRLIRAGAKVARQSPLLPDLADSARLYMRLLAASKSLSISPELYAEAQRGAAVLPPSDTRLAAERRRGTVISHRDWLAADVARAGFEKQWSALFREWDVVLYPAAPVVAFPHDHSLPIEGRHLKVDGTEHPYDDALFVWADPASTCGLPATTAPIDRTAAGLPIGMQIIGPYLEDRTPIAFAALLEREFGGFAPPPGYAG